MNDGHVYYQCDNCDATAREDGDDIRDAVDLHERLDVGGTYTDKECAHCGALVYPIIDKLVRTDRNIARIEFEAEANETVMHVVNHMADYGVTVETHAGERIEGFIGPDGATQTPDETEPHFELQVADFDRVDSDGSDYRTGEARRLPIYGTRIIVH